MYQDEMQQAHVPTPIGFNVTMVGPVIAQFGSEAAEAALPAEDRERRHLLVPGILRARLRFRPCLAAHARRTQGRQVRDQRPEDLDHAGAVCRLDLLPGAHGSGGEEAGRHLLHPGRHEDARHHRAPHHHHRWRPRGERGVLRQRRGARREPRRAGEQGLGLREVPARQRTHRASPGSAHRRPRWRASRNWHRWSASAIAR